MTDRFLHQDHAASIGLVAGWGRYPLVVAKALKREGHRISCLGIKDHADPALQNLCEDFHWLGWAKLGQAIRYFQRRGVQRATMAGKFHKKLLYQPWLWVHHLPDWKFLKVFYPYFVARSKDRNDDALLGTIVEAFAAEDIHFVPATDFAPELLVKAGPVSARRPTPAQQADIKFGWRLAKEMGRLDVGQSVCVKDRAILAVEAIEGTDACIRRAGDLCPSGGFSVVKVAKPQQDMRFDVPTIGVGTLETMVEAKARLLAIEAGRTIILDEAQFVEFANRHKLIVVALEREPHAEAVA